MRMIWRHLKCSCTLIDYLFDNTSRIERRPDVLEGVLCDAEGQKLSGSTLVGFMVSEIKSRISAQGQRMTKAEMAEKAWRHGFKGDFSIVDRIFHQTKFKDFDQGAI